MKAHMALVFLLPAFLVACDGGLDSEEVTALAGSLTGAAEPPGAALPPGPEPSAETAQDAAETSAAEIEHPYFPLRPGTQWIYEGVVDGSYRRDEVRVLEQTRVIAETVCTGVMQEVFLDGELAEVTTEWYARDSDGNVWKFGEETSEVDGVSEESWTAGEDGFVPWIFIPAEPRVGERYVGHRPGAREVLTILSLTATASVQAGFFADCLEAAEEPDDVDDPDIILFAPGVGLVSETGHAGRIELVSYR